MTVHRDLTSRNDAFWSQHYSIALCNLIVESNIYLLREKENQLLATVCACLFTSGCPPTSIVACSPLPDWAYKDATMQTRQARSEYGSFFLLSVLNFGGSYMVKFSKKHPDGAGVTGVDTVDPAFQAIPYHSHLQLNPPTTSPLVSRTSQLLQGTCASNYTGSLRLLCSLSGAHLLFFSI